MINTMECAVDAQSLISISLRKIHNSRTQRGGIKLHKNLLVSYVLRNARQVYMNEKYAEIYRMQQYEEVMTVCNEIQELNPLDVAEDCGEQSCGEPASLQTDRPSLCKEPEPSFYRSCCAEAHPVSHCDFPPASSNKTTVLDLDTHLVTTVESGFLHQDLHQDPQLQPCCQGAQPPNKKRKVDFGYYVSDVEETAGLSSLKRARWEDCCSASSEHLDTSNISNLISIFGSGFSGLVSRQAELETSAPGHLCSQRALASLGVWSTAIVAF